MSTSPSPNAAPEIVPSAPGSSSNRCFSPLNPDTLAQFAVAGSSVARQRSTWLVATSQTGREPLSRRSVNPSFITCPPAGSLLAAVADPVAG